MGCNNYVSNIYTGMDYNDKEINDAFKQLGLNEEEIKKVNIAHKIAEKIDDKFKVVAEATKQSGGTSGDTNRLKVLEEGLQKTFGFDRESMIEIDRLMKKKGGGGVERAKVLKGLQDTFDFDAESMKEIEKLMMKKKGGGSNGEDEDEAAAAEAAANAKKFIYGSLSTIKKMLDADIVDINVQDHEGEGDTALIRNTRKGNANVVDYLLRKKARVNIRNDEGQTAMDVAIQVEQKKCIELLANRFDVGDKIDGNVDKRGKWIPGTIVEVHGNGTFDVKYKDARERKGVDGKDLRISAEEISGHSNFGTFGRTAVTVALVPTVIAGTGVAATSVAAMGITVVIGLLSDNLFKILDNFIDQQINDDTMIAPLCKVITYILPALTLTYFMDWLSGDYIGFAKGIEGFISGVAKGGSVTKFSDISPNLQNLQDLQQYRELFTKNVSGSMDSELLKKTVQQTQNIGGITNDSILSKMSYAKDQMSNLIIYMGGLFISAYEITSGHPYITGGVILTTAMVGWIIKTYIWTRFRGSKEDNENLSKAIYSNHMRRKMILEQHMKKMKKEQMSKEIQRREYGRRLEKQIKLEEKMLQKAEETIKNSDENKQGYKWYKFVPGRLPDVDERYLRGHTAKSRSKSKSRSRSKTTSSSRKRRRSSKGNQG